MPAFLVPVDPGQCMIPLEKAVVLIGRQADCDVSLTHSRKISRKHCCIAQVNNKFIVRDLGSTNGVFLNGSRIEKEAVITIGDQLTIGDVRFKVLNEAPINEKKKSVKKAEGIKPVESPVTRAPILAAVPAPVSPLIRPPQEAPPSMDIPIAIDDEGHDFDVESTNHHPAMAPRKDRGKEIVIADDAAVTGDDDQVLPLQWWAPEDE